MIKLGEPTTVTANDNSVPAISAIEKYRLTFRSGHSKWATRVRFADGKAIEFTELMTRREATENALYQRRLGRL